jgi:tetratricopeptide (TPR) repeat protein
MKFQAFLQSSAAAALLAAVAVPVGGSAPKAEPSARAPLEVKIATADDFSRVEFHWMGGARAASRREGQNVVLRFSRNAQPDLSQLKVFPPKWMKGATSRTVNGALEITIALTDDADAKVGFADGATYVNAFARPPDTKAEETKAERTTAQPDGGVLKVSGQAGPKATSFSFPWKAPVGAAVFRRGETVWVVFDTKANVDLSGLPRVSSQYSRANTVQGSDFTAVCITTSPEAPVSAQAVGGVWTVTVGDAALAKPGLVTPMRDAEATQPALSAAVAGATRAIWLDDPIAGDRLAVITALAPSKGLDTARHYVDLDFLPSAQGLAVTPLAADLSVNVEGDLVHLARPGGMTLSTPQQAANDSAATNLADMPQASTMPGLLDFQGWSKLGPRGFFARYDALRNAAGAEAGRDAQTTGKVGTVAARMGLARFLVGSELSFEAIGELNLLAKDQPAMLGDPELRALRGAAKAMSGRYDEALADLSAPPVANDPSVALWRGYVAAKGGHWEDARKGFQTGYKVLSQMSPKWKARMARAYAQTGLELGDLKTAKIELSIALDAGAGAAEDTETSFIQARVLEADGDKLRALAIYDTLAKAPNGALASAGLLHATQLRVATGQIKPLAAADIYDGLRYRWRGDTTELESIRALGQIYMSVGRYRQALETLRSAGSRASDMPQQAAIQTDLYNDFRALFLDGGADGWEPIQAVALWRDFANTVNVPGADGDMMVRKMARRLVDVDLLSQAAELLKWQVENRLDGVAKAQVSTDLAGIYLMNRQPEQALDAINSSRTTVLPNAMNTERRALTARALIALGRTDQALEIIGTDKSADADDLRAEVAWKTSDWKTAGPLLEKRLGDRWKKPGALDADEEAHLLRAAIAYSLGNDDASLARLRQRFGGFVDTAKAPEYLKIAFVGVADARLSPADFNRVIADGDTFAGWVTKMKQRFREKPAPIGNGSVKQASAAPAALGPAVPTPAKKV